MPPFAHPAEDIASLLPNALSQSLTADAFEHEHDGDNGDHGLRDDDNDGLARCPRNSPSAARRPTAAAAAAAAVPAAAAGLLHGPPVPPRAFASIAAVLSLTDDPDSARRSTRPDAGSPLASVSASHRAPADYGATGMTPPPPQGSRYDTFVVDSREGSGNSDLGPAGPLSATPAGAAAISAPGIERQLSGRRRGRAGTGSGVAAGQQLNTPLLGSDSSDYPAAVAASPQSDDGASGSDANRGNSRAEHGDTNSGAHADSQAGASAAGGAAAGASYQHSDHDPVPAPNAPTASTTVSLSSSSLSGATGTAHGHSSHGRSASAMTPSRRGVSVATPRSGSAGSSIRKAKTAASFTGSLHNDVTFDDIAPRMPQSSFKLFRRNWYLGSEDMVCPGVCSLLWSVVMLVLAATARGLIYQVRRGR